MVGHAVDGTAANDQAHFKQIVDFRREVTQNLAGDKDGDGRYSISELYGGRDGKVSMAAYAATTNAPNAFTHPEQHAAASVGARPEVRAGWAKLREARSAGRFVPTMAERARAAGDEMKYDPRAGGWASSKTRWTGPDPTATAPGVGNLNVRRSPSRPSSSAGRDAAQETRRLQLRQFFEQQFSGQAPPAPAP